MAREAIPSSVISRVVCVSQTQLKDLFLDAVEAGQLQGLPPETWPGLGGLSRRLPCRAQITLGHLDEDVADIAALYGLTMSEACVLTYLVKRAGVVVGKGALLDAVALDPEDCCLKLVDVYLCKLRRKLDPHGVQVETVWGIGYSLSKQAAADIIARVDERRGIPPAGGALPDLARAA